MNARGRGKILKAILPVLLALALLLSSYGFTGSGGGYETTISIGTLGSIMQNSSGHDIGISYGGMQPVGQYNGGEITGFFGMIQGSAGSSNNAAIAITLLTPIDNSGSNGNLTYFYANVTGEDIRNCSLLIDRNPDVSIDWPSPGLQTFMTTLGTGRHSWSVTCTDSSLQQYFSVERNITVIQASGFDGETTDFSSSDLNNITNLTIAKSGYGKIRFSTPTDVSGGFDLGGNIIFGYRSIFLNSAALPELNKPAVLTINNPGISHPAILSDGEICNGCSILSYNINLTFGVSHFSNYSVTENSRLEIWDDTDYSPRAAGRQVVFYANYSNISNSQSLAGAGISCNIEVDNSGFIMSYNSTIGLYSYNRSFTALGSYQFNVTCNDTNDIYTGIRLSDFAVITGSIISGATNITFIKSERGNLTDQPGVTITQGGNVSTVNVNSRAITSSWQGYYGNITGKVILKNQDDSVLYDWSELEPRGEIYAARTPSIDFTSVNCTDAEEILAEEQFIGQLPGDGDTVTKTFNRTSHPSFNVGTIPFAENKCKSTNIYVSGAAQTENFYEVLISDSASNIIYTAILDPNNAGFDSSTYDFQMLVGENGHGNTEVTTYYFFMDLG